MPRQAPEPAELLRRLGKKELLDALQQAAPLGPTVGDRYVHWDRLRRMPVPPGLSAETWWLGLKLSRQSLSQRFPLVDTSGHSFHFALVPAIQRALHLVDSKSSGRIEALPEGLNRETGQRYIVRSLMEEAISSSILEGAATTRSEAKKLLAQDRAPKNRAERMVVNNYRTMQRLSALRHEPLSVELLLELHRTITEGTLDDPEHEGRFAQPGERRVVSDMEGNVWHEPPAPEELPARLESFIEFANAPDEVPSTQGGHGTVTFLHPVLRAILLHFWLAYDHPFLDGNGRTARAVFYWSMLRRGYWLFEFISISELLLESPTSYYYAFLYSETDAGDCTYFVDHQLRVIVRALANVERFIAERQAEISELRGAVRGLGLNHRQQEALRWFIQHPSGELTIARHRSAHSVTYQTARTDLLDLEARGLLYSEKVSRALVFYAVPKLEAKLQEERGARPAR